MQHVYFRCIDGHYFRGGYCPLDGWSSSQSVAVEEAAKTLEHGTATIAALAARGVAAEALIHVLIVEFGPTTPPCDALSLTGLVVDGRVVAETE